MVPEVLHRAQMRVPLNGNQFRVFNALLFEELRVQKGKRAKRHPVEEFTFQPLGLGAIGELTGLLPTTVSREMNVLVKKYGMVEKESTPGEGEGHRENRYRILPPWQWKVRFGRRPASEKAQAASARRRKPHINSEERVSSKLRRPLIKIEETSDRVEQESKENNVTTEQKLGAPNVAPAGTKPYAGNEDNREEADGEKSHECAGDCIAGPCPVLDLTHPLTERAA